MDEVKEVAPPKQSLTKEERSRVAKEAATRRWARVKKEASKAAKAKNAKGKKKPTGPREFMSALKTAEKRLSKAIQERAECSAKYAVLSAEIPSLQRLVVALRNPLGASPEYGQPMAPSLEQIVSGEPILYQNPPRPAPLPAMPHPVATAGRAMGGAIDVPLQEPEDEDALLRESALAGGDWH